MCSRAILALELRLEAGGTHRLEGGATFRPAKRRERPQTAAEPRVEHVVVLPNDLLVPRLTLCVLPRQARKRLAVGGVVHRDAVAPPELARDAPLADVLHPV